jgi:glutamate--cysteine ligase
MVMDIFFEKDDSVQSIASFLNAASDSECETCLGFELEHFIVKKGSHLPVSYFSNASSGEPGVDQVLEKLAEFYDRKTYETNTDGSQFLIGLDRPMVAITLEPSAQLEISAGPFYQIQEVEQMYSQFRAELDPILAELGFELISQGYHPTAKAKQQELIPKQRYYFMDKHFKQTGEHGICMMRGTAATQVSVDFFSEEDAINKFRVANVLGPLFAFITDNTPVFEGYDLKVADGAPAQTGIAEVERPLPKRMARMSCWDDTDPQRCLTAPFTFDDDFCFRTYAEDVLNAPAVFTPQPQPGTEPEYEGFSTFAQLLGGKNLDEATIMHIFSLFFYDVRLKSYIEIRQADSLPIEYALAYTALIKGLFYNPEVIDWYVEAFKYADSAAIAFAKTALRRDGYDAIVYQQPATKWLDQMLEFAYLGLPDDEHRYLNPLANLIKERRTLID